MSLIIYAMLSDVNPHYLYLRRAEWFTRRMLRVELGKRAQNLTNDTVRLELRELKKAHS